MTDPDRTHYCRCRERVERNRATQVGRRTDTIDVGGLPRDDIGPGDDARLGQDADLRGREVVGIRAEFRRDHRQPAAVQPEAVAVEDPYGPHWVTGVLATTLSDTELAEAAYTMAGEVVDVFDWDAMFPDQVDD